MSYWSTSFTKTRSPPACPLLQWPTLPPHIFVYTFLPSLAGYFRVYNPEGDCTSKPSKPFCSGRAGTCLSASVAELDICHYYRGSCSRKHYLRLRRCLPWTQKTMLIGILSLLQLFMHGLTILQGGAEVSQSFCSKGRILLNALISHFGAWVRKFQGTLECCWCWGQCLCRRGFTSPY